MSLVLLFLTACISGRSQDDKEPSVAGSADKDTASHDTAPTDTAEPIDTGPCPTDYAEVELSNACDGYVAREPTTYSLSHAALQVTVPDHNVRLLVEIAPDLGADGAPDLVLASTWHVSDTFSVWLLDAERRGEATTDDAWFSLHWSRLDYGYTPAAATYAPIFFPEDALVVKAGENPTSWFTFRAPLVPGLSLEDADLVVVGRASGRADAAFQTDVVPAGDLDGDGLSELLVPAPLAGDTTWGGTYEVGTGRVYVVPGATSGVVELDDLTDWVGGAGFADCESWDLSNAEPLGDVDGDGYDDVIFAGLSTLPHFGGESAAWIMPGPFSGGRILSDAVARVDGVSFYGREMAAGDFDGNGKPDLALTERAPAILGSEEDGWEETEIGAWVHYGPFEGVRQASDGVGLLPTVDGGYVGVWMEAADFDGDGFDDLLTSEFTSYDSEGRNLLAWGPFCETGAASRGAVTFTPEAEFDGLGGTVASGPDLDDDGLPDLAVTTRGTRSFATYLVLSSDLPTGESAP